MGLGQTPAGDLQGGVKLQGPAKSRGRLPGTTRSKKNPTQPLVGRSKVGPNRYGLAGGLLGLLQAGGLAQAEGFLGEDSSIGGLG